MIPSWRSSITTTLAGGPLEYMAAIFRKLTDTDEAAMQLALEFYGPMYLLYSVYDGAQDKDSVAPLLDAHIERFIAKVESGYRKVRNIDDERSCKRKSNGSYALGAARKRGCKYFGKLS